MKRHLPQVVIVIVVLLVVLLVGFTVASRNRPLGAPQEIAQPTRSDHKLVWERPASRRNEIADALRAQPGAARELARKSLPPSVEEMGVDGGLTADPSGHLIVAPGVREFFDYFLSATGEEPFSVLRPGIVAEIEKRLPPTAAQEAIDLLDRYLNYRERARGLYAEDGLSGDLSAHLEQIRALRREVFGKDNAEALFGQDATEDYIALAESEVLRDPSLSQEERQRRLDALEQQLPEAVRQAHEEVTKPTRFLQEQEELQAAGGSSEEIRALREKYWGTEAADRLEGLDRRQADWQARIDDYRTARAAIENDPSLSPEQKVQNINDLMAARFSETERIRVGMLDQIEQQK
jgi:lipase chaperone LimK